MAVIQFKDVWEMYRIKFIIDGKASWENFWALKDINFEVEEGEVLGIIGENGAGKSTILKLIAGMFKPDRGEVKVQGRVSGLLELGAGFQPELTGKENVYLNASLFGLAKNQIGDVYEEIVNFADIGKFINAPVKCYSQGMFVRLAFAIAIHIQPEILLIDDTLAVGDEHFQRKCIKKIFELKERGKTIIFVTHDMNMLSRLCKRAFFIKEGRIVRDGPTDKVIPFYSQMIGHKEGVGILEKEPLSLIFNNGKMLLNWQGRLLTSNQGGYTVFSIADKWHSSFSADWEVSKEGDKLVAIGKFSQIALTQIWRLELTDNCEIKWDVEIDSQESLEIDEAYTNIMLINEYAQWFTPFEEGVFPSIDENNKSSHHLLDGNVLRGCIGVKGEEALNEKFPSFTFEQSNYMLSAFAQISNADYISNCRVLQFKTMGLQNYSADKTSRFTYFSGRILFDIQDIDSYLKSLRDEFILSDEKLKLTVGNGQGILSYDGKELTKGSRISTAIYINGRWYHSRSAHWKVNREGDCKLVAHGIWRDLPVVQIWEIETLKEHCFSWKVKLLVNEIIDIEEQYIDFMCSKDYTHWFCDYGKGNFSDNFLEATTDMLQKCIPDGAIGLESQDIRSPVVSLRFSKELNNFAKILNSDFYNRARILRINKVEPEKNIRFLPGEYPCFSMELAVGKDKRNNAIESSMGILENGRLKFIFDNGKGRIYWNGIELTKRLGLYTSLRSGGRWYDSLTCALWKTEEKDGKIIMAEGKWLHLPISQHWWFSLKHNFIEFDVKMKVNEKIGVDRLQTNIMLSEGYLEWTADKNKGHFPFFKNDIDDDWDCVHSSGNEGRHVGVSGNSTDKTSLPSILLLPQDTNPDPDCFLNIVNSDIYHRGRVLQYLNAKKMQISPGEYPYFSGKISIEA